jgi:transaldolase
MSANQTSIADTGDFESMRAYQPHDATTNPSLIFAATQKSEYSLLLDKAIVDLTSKNIHTMI